MKHLLLKLEPVIWLLFGQGILLGTMLLTGWLLVVAGTVVLTAWGVYSYIKSPEDLWTKLATGALVIGFVLLLLSAVLDRVRDLRTDRYREVER